MEDQNKLSIPFLTRNMLAFEHGIAFSLQIISKANLERNITIRGMTREGVFTFTHTTRSDSQSKTETFRIPDIPIMISVIDADGQFIQGGCFIILNLIVNEDILYQLCAGPIYAKKGISYPATLNNDLRPEAGFLAGHASTNPAAGAELSLTVPSGQIWKPISGRFTLVTAAVAGNRRVHIVITPVDGGTIDCFCDIDQIISETKVYSFAAYGELPARTNDNDILIPIPNNLILNAGSTITTETNGLNAGDDFSAMLLFSEDYFRSG